eukprot:scaffold27450_cov36-Tisochrysis_lutea.AAC.1
MLRRNGLASVHATGHDCGYMKHLQVLFMHPPLQSSRSTEHHSGSAVKCIKFVQAIINPSDDAYFNILSSVCNIDELRVMDVRTQGMERCIADIKQTLEILYLPISFISCFQAIWGDLPTDVGPHGRISYGALANLHKCKLQGPTLFVVHSGASC